MVWVYVTMICIYLRGKTRWTPRKRHQVRDKPCSRLCIHNLRLSCCDPCQHPIKQLASTVNQTCRIHTAPQITYAADTLYGGLWSLMTQNHADSQIMIQTDPHSLYARGTVWGQYQVYIRSISGFACSPCKVWGHGPWRVNTVYY
jgi:hypothetical protein